MGKTLKHSAPKKGGARSNERMTRSKKSKQLNNGLENSAQTEQNLNAQLRLMGLYAADTVGDGNCLFRALSDQMYGYPELHRTIRQQICDFLAVRSDRFAGFVDGSFDQYIKNMRENGTYGGHLELSAFAQLALKHIKVVQPGLVYVVSGVDESPEMVRAREAKEEERKRAQDALEPGSEGPPPSERTRRKLRRENAKMKKTASTMSDATVVAPRASASSAVADVAAGSAATAADAAAAPTSPRTELAEASSSTETSSPSAPVEAYGPLYIAYHNWEHYSSIRNLDGPHSGLPRIKERRIEGAVGSSGGLDKGKGRASDVEEVSDFGEDDEAPTDKETLVMKSCPGHSLPEVRALLKANNGDFDAVVEALIAKDAEEEHELDKSSPMALAQRDAEGGNAPGSSQLAGSSRTEQLRADHLREWRASTPSSVDTNATHSSLEVASVSTHATTDEPPSHPHGAVAESGDEGRKLRSSTKRAASTDAMTASIFRESKRRSNSPQTPADDEHDGGGASPAAHEEADTPGEVSRASVVSALEDTQAASAVAAQQGGGAAATGRPRRKTVQQEKREKRDEARTRRREREISKALQRKATASGRSAAGSAGYATPASDNSKAAVEMRGFRELHI